MATGYGETPIGLKSEIYNLAGVLLRKVLYKMPRYQRPYTWAEREVRQLIQDLWRAWKREATFYFIGQIVLVRSTRGRYEIADGQQRLATLTMIFAYVRDRLPHRAKHYQGLVMDGPEPRVTLREEDASFFQGYVQEPNQITALRELPETGVDSKDLLAAAARTIHAELGHMKDADLDSFMTYVARCCTLNVVDADERGCAQTVFNALNKRGSPLSEADIIKSDLLENSELSTEEADAAARKWEEVEAMLQREHFATLLNMMPFLLTGARLISPGDLFSFRRAIVDAGGVRHFLFDRLPRYAEALLSVFHETVDVGAASADVNRRLRLMKQVEEWEWAPAALVFLVEHADQPERARRFFQALDRYAFACELSVVDSDRQERRYEHAVRYAGDDSKLYGKGGALELTEAEHMRFIARLNRASPRDRMRRLIMLRLEAAMPGGSHLTVRNDATVEHVLPKNGGSQWNDRFPDKRLRDEFANMIGNCVLITHKQNEAAGNRSYGDKRKVYFNASGGPPVHAVTKDIVGIEDWTYEAIEERQERLIRILCSDWDLVRGFDSQAA